MTGGDTLEFSLEVGLEQLGDCRAFIDRAGEALGLDRQLLGDLRLVVDEAVTNIVLHGYGGNAGPLEMSLSREANELVIRIRDQAPPFTPDAVVEPALDTALALRKPGGMGIFLMRQMMDQVVFQPQPGGGNELRLVKRLG